MPTAMSVAQFDVGPVLVTCRHPSERVGVVDVDFVMAAGEVRCAVLHLVLVLRVDRVAGSDTLSSSRFTANILTSSHALRTRGERTERGHHPDGDYTYH